MKRLMPIKIPAKSLSLIPVPVAPFTKKQKINMSDRILSDRYRTHRNNLRKKEMGIPAFTNMESILKIFDEEVKSGNMSIMTENNYPFYHHFFKSEFERRLKIQNLSKNYSVSVTQDYYFELDNRPYECEAFITPVKISQHDSIPDLSNDTLNKILEFCQKENITHIYNILQIREAVIIDFIENDIFTIDDKISSQEFSHFGFNENNIIENPFDYKSRLEYEYEDSNKNHYYKDEDYYSKEYTNMFDNTKKGYVYNTSYFTVIGAKVFDESTINEWLKCKDSVEYFYNRYIKK